MRGGTRTEVITPSDADVKVLVGWLKFTLLNTLNASPRNSNRARSLIAKVLCRAKSVWKNPGPVKILRPAPKPPTAGLLNWAFSDVLRNVTDDGPFTREPTAVGSPVKTALVATSGYR